MPNRKLSAEERKRKPAKVPDADISRQPSSSIEEKISPPPAQRNLKDPGNSLKYRTADEDFGS
jgi:hypothetical protein